MTNFTERSAGKPTIEIVFAAFRGRLIHEMYAKLVSSGTGPG